MGKTTTNTTNTPAAWAQLPNAPLIDWVLSDVRAHPLEWAAEYAAWDAARGAARGAAWDAAWDAAQVAAWDAAYAAARDAARDAAWGAARAAAWDAAWDAAWNAARVACAALIAWDLSGQLLTGSSLHRASLVAMAPHLEHALLLLQPAIARWETQHG